MSTEDIVGLLTAGTFLFFLVTERMFPRRAYPPIRWWTAIGFVGFIVTAAIGTLMPMLVPASLSRYHLFDLSGLGIAAQVLVGYPLTALGSALVHRSFHACHPLWRMGHQLHHSPRRLDIPGAVFFHPLDIAVQTAPATIVSVFLLGLTPVAGVAIGYVSVFYGMFQHWNVRTPRWLGYLIQRPESHGLHHELGIHGRNYSDFPLWDMLMGTFHNPDTFDGDVGFAGDAPKRIGAMLIFQDVNASERG